MTPIEPSGPSEDIVERLRTIGERGYTVRGQQCAGDIMLEAATYITHLREEIERTRAALSDSDILLTELLDGKSKGEIWGIGKGTVLRGKLMTVRATARVALARHPAPAADVVELARVGREHLQAGNIDPALTAFNRIATAALSASHDPMGWRTALKPFAKRADSYDSFDGQHDFPDSHVVLEGFGTAIPELRVEHFREARAALALEKK